MGYPTPEELASGNTGYPAPEEAAPVLPRVDQLIQGQVSKFVGPQQQPAQDLGQFAGNAWGDVKQLAGGLGVVGSTVDQRFLDSFIPKALYENDMGAAFAKDPLNAMLPRGIIQPGDLELGTKLVGGIIDHYKSKFVEPILKGDFNTPWNYFLSNPVMFAGDVLPAAGPLKAAGRAAMARIPGAASAATRAGEIASGVANRVPGVKYMRDRGAAANELREADLRYMQQATDQDMRNLQEMYHRIPQDIRNDLYEIGEYTNPARYHEAVQQHPELRDFLQQMNRMTDDMRERLSAAGGAPAMSPEQTMLQKYGPATLARHGDDLVAEARSSGIVPPDYNGGPRLEWLYRNGRLDTRLGVIQAEMQAVGIDPPPFRNVTRQATASSNQLRGSLFGRDVEGLQVRQHDPNAMPRDVMTSQRTPRGEMLSAEARGNAFDNFVGRHLEQLAFLHLRDMIGESMAGRLAGQGQHALVNVRQFMANAAQAAGVSPEATTNILQALPDSIQLPKGAADVVNDALRTVRWRGWDEIGNAFKSFTLGTNPRWPVNEAIQSAMTFVASANKSPRDLATSLMAYAMAFNPELRARMPHNWVEHLTETRPWREIQAEHAQNMREMLGRGYAPRQAIPALSQSVAAISANYEWFTSRIFQAQGMVGNVSRVQKGLHSIMRAVEDADPSTRVAFTDAMNLTRRNLQVEAGLANPQVMETAARDVLRWYGDYGPLAAKLNWLPRKFFPFWMWNRHAFSIAKALPAESPIKTALLNQVYVHAPELFQDKDMPEAYRRAGMIKIPGVGPNGGELYHGAKGSTPFMTTYEDLMTLGDMMSTVYGGQGASGFEVEAGKSYMGVHPLAGAHSVVFQGRNPTTGGKFRNPHLIQDGEHQYKQTGEDKFTEIDVSLPVQNIPAKLITPTLEKDIRTAIAYPHKPTDVTTIGDKAIARNQKHPEGLKNYNAVQLMLNRATKYLPTEGSITKEDEEGMKASKDVRIMKKAAMQTYRTKRD